MLSRFLIILSLLACIVLSTPPGYTDDRLIAIEAASLRLRNDETDTSSEYNFFLNDESYALGLVFHDSPLAGPESAKGIRSLRVTSAELLNAHQRKLDCIIFVEGRPSKPLVKLNSETPALGLTFRGQPADVGDLIFQCKRT